MKARAKLPYRVIRAFTGREIVNYEWRPVPSGGDDEAERLWLGGYLELQPEPPAVEIVDTVDKPEPEATSSAARLAADLGLDLSFIEGTGAGGRILKRDVEAAFEKDEEE